MKATLITIGTFILLFGSGWVLQSNHLAMFKFFAPKYEQARRETFEESKSYRQGAIQELQNMQFQYEQADDSHKAALASIILRRAADFQDLPADLQIFIKQLKNTKTQ